MSDADKSLPPDGSNLSKAFEGLITALHVRGVRYAIIGGIATIQHTRVRTTDDVDALISLPQIAMPAFFEDLRGRGFDLDVMKSIRELRDDGLTTVHFKDVLVDLMRPVLPAYERVLDRAVSREILGHTVRVSSAEGLIVMKLIAMRPQDEADVQDLLAAYRSELDLDYVREELESVTIVNDPRRRKFEEWLQRLADAGDEQH